MKPSRALVGPRSQEPVPIQRYVVSIFSFPCTHKIPGDFRRNCGCASPAGLGSFSGSLMDNSSLGAKLANTGEKPICLN